MPEIEKRIVTRIDRASAALLAVGVICGAFALTRIAAGQMHPLWLLLHTSTIALAVANLRQKVAYEVPVDRES